MRFLPRIRAGILFTLFLLIFLCATAAAETRVTFAPDNPRVGDYVDVTVTPDREGALGVRYTLRTPKETVFEGKEDSHFSASFRPRTEAVYTLTVTVVYGKKDEETVSVTVPVSGTAPRQEGPDVVYSQKDGWWHNKVYSKTYKRSVEKAGCALFALSHALQRMGLEGDDIQPDALAAKYSKMYIPERGTDNERLLTAAGEEFGFQTHTDLVESEEELTAWFRMGGYFSFMIANGHIALADGLSEDGRLAHIVDSAPGATFERIRNGRAFVQAEDGSFREVFSPEEMPGIRYFFETREWGGMEYWLELSYCAKQGMRPLRRPWMTMETESGPAAAEPEYAGALVTRVTVNGEEQRVPTRELSWTTLGADAPQLALVTRKKGASFTDANGKKKDGISKPVSYGMMVPVLEVTKEKLYVFYKGVFGYIRAESAELLPVEQEAFSTGLVSVNGRTAGTTAVKVRAEASAKSRTITEWKPGVPVALIRQSGEFWLAEGKGIRGWIHEKYLTMDEKTAESAN